MGVSSQAADSTSTLHRFLDARLPQRALVADTWARDIDAAPWSAIAVDADRKQLGLAAEMRISLDLAQTPSYWDLLSFLPSEQCHMLLSGAGYSQDGYEHLADTGTTDALLLQWQRSAHPVGLGDMERAALAACWDATSMRSLVQGSGQYSVQLRRSFFAHTRDQLHWRDGLNAEREAAIAGLSHLWRGYLRHGRRQLTELGDQVTVAPELAAGFGKGDIVADHALIDIKVVLEPDQYFLTWLDQLLGYTLLDWFNIFRLDTVGLYLGWHALLISASLDEILAAASPGPSPSLEILRSEFRQAIGQDLDRTIEAQLRDRYPVR